MDCVLRYTSYKLNPDEYSHVVCDCKLEGQQQPEPVGPHRAQEEVVNGMGLDEPLINQLACMPTHLGRVTCSLRVSDLWFASQFV